MARPTTNGRRARRADQRTLYVDADGAVQETGRLDPLPPNTFFVAHRRTVSQVVVTGPGVVTLRSAIGERPVRFVVGGPVRPGRWRRWRLRTEATHGSDPPVELRLGVLAPGEHSLADLGRWAGPSLWIEPTPGDNDPFTAVLVLLQLLVAAVALPFRLPSRRRRRAARIAEAERFTHHLAAGPGAST